MKLMTKKLAALLMAAVMVLSMSSLALAEQPAEVPAAGQPALAVHSALTRGATLKFDMDVQVNNDVVLPLLGSAMGSADSSSQTMLTSILSAINKLTTTVVYNMGGLSARIGTPSGDLITLQGRMNPETFENSYATSLLPGTTITMDPEMMKQAMASLPQNATQQITPEEAQAMIAPYSNAVTAFLNDSVMPSAQMEQGPFEVAGVATFEARATVPVTSHGAANFLEAMLNVFRTDTKLQGLLSQSLKTAESAGTAAGTDSPAPQDIPSMIKQMEDGIADIRSKADNTVGTVRYYSSPSDATAPAYLEIETDPASTEEPAYATVLIQNQEKASNIAIALLVKGAEPGSAGSSGEQTVSLSTKAPEGTPTDAPAEPAQPTDWAALHNAVLNGEDQTATLINLTIKTETTDASADSNFAFDLRAPMAGMGSLYAGIALNASSALGDKVDQKGTLTISALSPAPMITVHFSLTETDEAVAEVPAGAQTFVFKQDTTEAETQQLLGAVMAQGLPAMLENLKTALPEEAGILTLLIQQMMGQTAPAAQP